jgi:hypothetical protein
VINIILEGDPGMLSVTKYSKAFVLLKWLVVFGVVLLMNCLLVASRKRSNTPCMFKTRTSLTLNEKKIGMEK